MNGKMCGIYKSYYNNGQLNIFCSYINDEICGEYKEYYANGELKESSIYKNGIKND